MLDFNGAREATSKIATNSRLLGMGINPVAYINKGTWSAAINGAYALLSPLIHKDYASRFETSVFFNDAINKAFLSHHEMNRHSQEAYSVGPGFTNVPINDELMSMFTIPLSTPIIKLGRPVEVPTVPNLAGGDNTPSIAPTIPQEEPIMADPASPSFALLNI